MHIAKEYGTSQGPVREALRELEILGFVRKEPNRGTYVREVWQRGMLELYEVRAALEEFATRTATPVLREDTSALWDAIDGMAQAAEHGDVAGVVDCSERFHRTILEASGDQLLANVERPEHHRPHRADDGRAADRPRDGRRGAQADRASDRG